MRRPRADDGPDRLAVTVASALLERDLPGVTPTELDAAQRFVQESILALPDVTRWGVGVAGRLTSAVLSMVARAPYSSLSAPRRSLVATAVFARHVPLVSEYGTLTSGLGLVAVVESRHSGAGG